MLRSLVQLQERRRRIPNGYEGPLGRFFEWPRQRVRLPEPLGATKGQCRSSSVGRARPCQGRGRGFESRLLLQRLKHLYAQLPCVIVAYTVGSSLVVVKIGISRVGCSKRPIYRLLARFQLYAKVAQLVEH